MADQTSSGGISQVVKWVGYVTAILSLLATIGGLAKLAWGRIEANRKVSALLSAEALQLQGHDYTSGWQTLEQAEKIKPDSEKVRAAQEALAMEWIDDVPIQENGGYKGFSDKLGPVLTQSLAASKPGQHHADLQAHLGWIYFRQVFEGRDDLEPADLYAKAVAEDPNNPYGQAMWGYWIMVTHGPMADAERHFAAALASQREGDYVRQVQSSAFSGCGQNECEEDLIRVVNGARKENRKVSTHARKAIFAAYYFRLMHPDPAASKFINAVPPAENVATLHWLFDGTEYASPDGNGIELTFFLAMFQEAAGQREEALANYKMIAAKLPANSGPAGSASAAAIKRLSH